ncbi:unnamed protein product [Kluyveromyces dobzhanskii CBS 2104]|uniref:WGS project CCBQ000000000 data, contig 00015 n=1 Tax=Kluyveromyces dobzhanskii CBS 2104 TaxID=1427455 RepID=A0A0A8LBI1_9SACH|nr:unnamed protein product [Kluyveromyces dobzhanskii CBS 2104]
MTTQQFFTLSNGNKIPAVAIVGTGTAWYKSEETDATFSQDLVNIVKETLDTVPGVVHLDAAEIYRTYPELGAALKDTKKPREEIFITDKYSTLLQLSENPTVALESSLKKLGVDYVDLYLIHSPIIDKNGTIDIETAWKHLEALYKSGKAKNIGVSNFTVEDLEKLLAVAEIKPQVNQIEFSPFLQNQTPGIVEFSQKNNILLEAYSPLGPLQKRPADSDKIGFYSYIAELTKKYSKSEAQVILLWVYKRGILPVTTSSKIERVQQAQDIFSFDLTDEEVKKITQLGLEQPALRLYWADVYTKYNSEAQK